VSLQIVDQSNGAPSFREIGSRYDQSRLRQLTLLKLPSVTNSDGRCLDLLPPRGSEDAAKRGIALESGQNYKVIFQTKTYFEQSGRVSFYPWVEVRARGFPVPGIHRISL